jgi:tetratricopeptide (TPR) repeat protein
LTKESRSVLFLMIMAAAWFCLGTRAACRSVSAEGRDHRSPAAVSSAEKAFHEGRFRDAAGLYSKAIRLSPLDGSLYLGRGMSLEMAGKTAKAAADYLKALEHDPDNYRAMENLAGIYERSGKRTAEAVALYRKALEVDPRTEWKENLAVWIEMLRSRLNDGTRSAVACWHRGNREAAGGNLEKAEEFYSESLALNPLLYQACFSRGLLRARRGEFRAAMSDFDLALEIDPRFTPALVRRGLALEVLGRPEEARESFHRATVLSPREAEPHYHLGRLLEKAGKHEAALASYEKALKLKPKRELAGSVRERISRVRPLVRAAGAKDLTVPHKRRKKMW